MIKKQMSLVLSPYSGIYELIIPKDNLLRQMNELVDFTFIYDELANVYCQNNGRGAKDPVRMFKYLLLKSIFDISDVDVVERSIYDMSFKYFLDMTPEEGVMDASSLTKFRKLRLKDSNFLDLLINKTVEIALEQGVIKSKSIIVDSTHTKARYNQKSPRENLVEHSKRLRKAVYAIDETMKEQFPAKVNNGLLEDELEYCQKLITIIENEEIISGYPAVKEKINMLKELVDDDLEQLALLSKDADAKVGHKTADTSFFGYKTHIAMTEERIITAAMVTSGEKHDGKQLQELVEKSEEAGIEVRNIIGDTAYSEKENIGYAKENNICLVFKIEAKNSELKHSHGYDVASASGLFGMRLQGATTIFAVNLKRIITLMREK